MPPDRADRRPALRRRADRPAPRDRGRGRSAIPTSAGSAATSSRRTCWPTSWPTRPRTARGASRRSWSTPHGLVTEATHTSVLWVRRGPARGDARRARDPARARPGSSSSGWSTTLGDPVRRAARHARRAEGGRRGDPGRHDDRGPADRPDRRHADRRGPARARSSRRLQEAYRSRRRALAGRPARPPDGPVTGAWSTNDRRSATSSTTRSTPTSSATRCPAPASGSSCSPSCRDDRAEAVVAPAGRVPVAARGRRGRDRVSSRSTTGGHRPRAASAGSTGAVASARPGHDRRRAVDRRPTSSRCWRRSTSATTSSAGGRLRAGGRSVPLARRPALAAGLRRPGPRRPLALPAPPAREARGDPAAVGLVVPRRRDPGQGDLPRPPDRRGRRPAAGGPVGPRGRSGRPAAICSGDPSLRAAVRSGIRSSGRSAGRAGR